MKVQDIISIGSAFIEVFIFAGNVYGWSSLNFVLEREEYFADQCLTLQNNTKPDENQSSLCGEQIASFNLVFTLAVFFSLFLSFPLGIFFDYYGTWIFRTLATTLFSLGYMLLAISSSTNSALTYPFLIFIGVGGLSLLTSNIQTANFSKSARGLIVTLLNGLFDSSVAVLFIFKKLYDVNINLHTIAWIMTGLTVFLWLRTYFVMPKRHMPYPLPEKYVRYGWKQWICFREDQIANESDTSSNAIPLETSANEDNFKDVTSQQTSFKNCLKTIVFWTNCFHYSALSFRFFIFLGTLQPWLKSFANESEISHFTDVVGILLMLGVFVSPLNGIIIDVATKKLKRKNINPKILNLKAFLISMFTTSILGIIFSILIVIPTTYPSFVLMLLTRGFIFGGNAAFLSINFPIEHFGKLYGITNFMAGVVSLLQYAIVHIALEVDPTYFYINIALLVFTISSLMHPIALFFTIKRYTKRLKSMQN